MTGQPAATPPAYDALGEAKALLRATRAGTLATVDGSGAPFASLVAVATAPSGAPLLLLSRLAAHTAQLDADPRCSLLLGRPGRGDPLAHPRLTVLGRAARLDGSEREAARTRFLARNPKSALYADFPDFGFFRVDVAAGLLNGGFGRAATVAGADLLTATEGRDALLAAERSALDHLNADHRDALAAIATALGRGAPGAWRASGLDPEGIDLVCGDRTARVAFEAPVAEPGALRAALVRLTGRARTKAEAASEPPDEA